jgi:hypothetical protein
MKQVKNANWYKGVNTLLIFIALLWFQALPAPAGKPGSIDRMGFRQTRLTFLIL